MSWLLCYGSAAAKSLQSCPTLCDHIDGSPPGSHVPGILQARTLEWVAIAFSNAWKWKVKVKSLSRVRLFGTPWTVATVLGQLKTGITLMCSDPLCSLWVFSLHLVLSLPPILIFCAPDSITCFGYGNLTWAGIFPQISSRIWFLLSCSKILGD